MQYFKFFNVKSNTFNWTKINVVIFVQWKLLYFAEKINLLLLFSLKYIRQILSVSSVMDVGSGEQGSGGVECGLPWFSYMVLLK